MTPSPETATLVWHDSEVAAVVVREDDLVLRFSAAHVWGWQASNAGPTLRGYLAPVRLVMRQARWTGDLSLAWGRIAQGRMVHAHQQRSELPITDTSLHAGRLELAFSNGCALVIDAQGFAWQVDPQARFVESSAC